MQDGDGDFLAIEAAESDGIPSWLGPECSNNRVLLSAGALHFLPPTASKRAVAAGTAISEAGVASLSAAGDHLRAHRQGTRAAPAAREAIAARLRATTEAL